MINSGCKNINVMGTMQEIGFYTGEINENTPCNPMSLYGKSTNILRHEIQLYAENKCVFQWLRAFYIYGDDNFGNSIFCKIRKAVDNGSKTFPFTTGKNKYDFIHVDDLAMQISETILQKEVTGIINCCSGRPVSLADQVEWYIRENKLDIKLEGRLDTKTAPKLKEELENSLNGVEELTFDLSELIYISSAGLRIILSTQKTMNKQGSMKVTNVQDIVMEVFESTGFVDILTIE